MRLGDAFYAHPASVGESYGQHLQAAAGFGAKLWLAGLLCMIHAFLPFLFVRSASAMVEGLHDRMILHRRRNPAAATPQVPAAVTVPTVR